MQEETKAHLAFNAAPSSSKKTSLIFIHTKTYFTASWLLSVSVFVGLALSLGMPILFLPIFLFFLFDCGVFIFVSVVMNSRIIQSQPPHSDERRFG